MKYLKLKILMKIGRYLRKITIKQLIVFFFFTLLSYNNVLANEDSERALEYLKKANALFLQKRLEEAIITYDLAIKYKPDFTEAYNNRKLILNKLGK